MDETITVEEPYVTWSDLAGLEDCVKALRDAVVFPMRFSRLYSLIQGPRKILLYGPSDTEKVLLAKAVATIRNSTLLTVSAHDLTSIYELSTLKGIQSLFSQALARKPSVIFIKDIDQLYSKEKPDKWIQKDLLEQLQDDYNNEIFFLASTDFPWNVDLVITRCFERHIYVPFPDEHARAEKFKEQLESTPNNLTDADFVELGKRVINYSDADIELVVRYAVLRPITLLQKATHFRKVMGPNPLNEAETVDDLWTPCSPSARGACEMHLMDIPSEKLLAPIVTMTDMNFSFYASKPTVDEDYIEKMENFILEFRQKF